ncbi:MAG: aminotransferase class I/II-fold pyridoxal phosphate-dependent enzyme [Haloarculaceae archaeon]
MFPRIEYVDWIVPRIEAATHDLGSSDLHPEAGDRDRIVPPRLADLPTPDDGLRTLVAAAYGVDAERVLVTPGASAANAIAAAVALGTAPDPSAARVLVEKPGYEPHVATPEGLGATVDRYRRDETWALDPGRIDAATMDETCLVVASNRHNPTGARADRETLAAAAEAAASADARLLVDEVYAPYGAVGEGGAFGGPTGADLPNAVITGSLTKFWGFGPLRIGWLVADPSFVERAREVAVHLSAVAGPSRTLARRALAAGESLAADGRERCLANHDLLRSFLEDRADLDGRVFEGCPYAFLTHESADGETVAAAAWEEDVLVVPGRFFGATDGFRVSLGVPPGDARDGLEAFGRALDGLV